ncbi:MAG TPA: hypothetical protein PKE26_11225 [Kiritimatiellia bacterium]|nr:hypothetical protein [Kiritimatiellia bacterium]
MNDSGSWRRLAIPACWAAALAAMTLLWARERAEVRRLQAERQRVAATAEAVRPPVIPATSPPDNRRPVQVGPVQSPAPELPPPEEEAVARHIALDDLSGSPDIPDEVAGALARFDWAMDHEFERLETREQASVDGAEVSTIQRIKAKLTELDDLYRRADLAVAPEEKTAIAMDMQAVMGQIIGLSRHDRNERLGRLAGDIGYTDPAAIDQFIREVDRIVHETHMDWSKLFNRAPPEAGPAAIE